jgi:L-2-hydroxyglutarate oxidase LhgO
MEKNDVTIIGAGVIGLAVAAEISRPDWSIFIIEKNTTHGRGISSRNSEVIHGGIYYPQNSLKASLCVEGNRLLYEIASSHHIPHKKTGKMIVATTRRDTAVLEELYANGRANGAENLQILNKKQVGAMEPHVQAQAALHSPDTGIISVHDLMNFYLTQAQRRKAQVFYRTEILHIEKEGNHYRLTAQHDKKEVFEFSSAVVINAAGLESDKLANLLGTDYHLHFCKGSYCSLSGIRAGTIKRLVYPTPAGNQAGLGIHLTMDLQGRFKLGPDATYIERKEDYSVDALKAEIFYQSAKKFLPFLKKENIYSDMAGIRPKLQGPGEDFCDFVIREDFPGFINLVGIESPGITASPAIARHVRKKYLGG